MIDRKLLKELHLLASQFRIVTLIGPRQAGKSTLARQAFPDYSYHSLEDPDVLSRATYDPRAFLGTIGKQVILDEVQRFPELINYLQGIVDADPSKGQYILTGSHQLELAQGVTQSLAGRTAMLTLLPFSLEELPESSGSVDALLLKGSMPGCVYDNVEPLRYYRNYYQSYVERDVRQLIQLKNLATFQRFIRLCAGRAGQLLNNSSLASEVGVSSHTIAEWLSVLEASFIIVRLQPYYAHFNRRHIKAPKLYFVDTGLLCWLLGIETEAQLQRDPLRGNIFENFVVMEFIKGLLNRGRDLRLYFYRDSKGNEVDLVLERGRNLIPIEIKSSSTWHSDFLKGCVHFSSLATEQVPETYIIYSGEQELNFGNNTGVPLASLSACMDRLLLNPAE
jgi:uncharacterized protein